MAAGSGELWNGNLRSVLSPVEFPGAATSVLVLVLQHKVAPVRCGDWAAAGPRSRWQDASRTKTSSILRLLLLSLACHPPSFFSFEGFLLWLLTGLPGFH
ncbi:hypothetical protein MUG91_G6n347 [Manis pentadactyla]|nr:hypothetical protein MUG91_G6n347 [Manis pentadactyla]